MALPVKPRLTKYSIILLCVSVIYGYLLSVILLDYPSLVDKGLIILVLILYFITIAFTLIMVIRPKNSSIINEYLYTGLSVGSMIFTMIFLIRLL